MRGVALQVDGEVQLRRLAAGAAEVVDLDAAAVLLRRVCAACGFLVQIHDQNIGGCIAEHLAVDTDIVDILEHLVALDRGHIVGDGGLVAFHIRIAGILIDVGFIGRLRIVVDRLLGHAVANERPCRRLRRAGIQERGQQTAFDLGFCSRHYVVLHFVILVWICT